MGADAAISKTEMAAVVELLTTESAIRAAVERIIHYRDEMAKAKGQERNKLETQFLESANASQISRTLEDYADSNFRHSHGSLKSESIARNARQIAHSK